MNGKPWTETDIAELKKLYPDNAAKAVAEIIGRSLGAVYGMAKKLNLSKSDAFYASVESGRTLGQHDTSGCFVQGQKPWNKGKAFPSRGRSAEMHFKKGRQPHNTKPIGSERLNDGYLQRKMTNTGYPPKDWVPVHRLLWEQHNGPIPNGEVLIFSNGDRTDIRLDNLEVLTRGQLAIRNSIHNYPEELAELMRLQGQVKRQIRKREKAEHEK